MERRAVLRGSAAVGFAAVGGYASIGASRRISRPAAIADLSFDSREGWNPNEVEPRESPVLEWHEDDLAVVASGVVAVGSVDHEAHIEDASFDADDGTLRFVVAPHVPLSTHVSRIALFFIGRSDMLRVDSYDLKATLTDAPERVVVEQVDHQGKRRRDEVRP